VRAFLFAALRAFFVIVLAALTLFLIASQESLRITVNGIRAEKLATVTSLKQDAFVARIESWAEVFTMLLGLALIALAFLAWMNATRRGSTPGMLAMLG